MVEAIRYTQLLPDKMFYSYAISIEEEYSFKEVAANFSDYKNLDFACFHFGKKTKKLNTPTTEKKLQMKSNWSMLVYNEFKGKRHLNLPA